jgi:hypothetical protein
MILLTLIIIVILLFINYLPVWLLISSNRYNYIQGIIFGILFIGIWGYKVYVEIELQDTKKMDLKEAVYKSTHRSKARVRSYYHEIWDFVYFDEKKYQTELEKKSELSAILLRVLTVESFILLYLAYRGKKSIKKQAEFYSKNIMKYSVFLILCCIIEFLNYNFLAL